MDFTGSPKGLIWRDTIVILGLILLVFLSPLSLSPFPPLSFA